MSNRGDCPQPGALQNLVERGGTDADIDLLASHIEQCDSCGQAMDTLLGTDATTADLRSGKSINVPTGPVIDNLKAKLRGLKPAASVALAQNNTLLEPASAFPVAEGNLTPKDATEGLVSFLSPPENSDEIGRLGGYRVLKKLGAGGMGVVFLAEDTQLRRQVALKTLLPAFASHHEGKERFLREARAMAKVEHEHIIAIYQVGEDHGIPFIAMPYLKGEALDVRLRSGPLPIREAVRIAMEMAEGLAAAHEHGLIHRDIKPGNVWLEGNQGRVKLLDFGLARAQLEDLQLTHSGAIIGTPAFMAPEQARGEAIDGRADIFSIGAVLYTMLTGKRPFEGASTMTILTALALKEPPTPQSINSEIPANISKLTMRLLAKDRDQRPATASLVADDLRASLQVNAKVATDDTVAERPATLVVAATHPNKNRRFIAALGLISAVVLAAGILIYRLPTKNGELILEADSDQIEVKISQTDRDPVVLVVDKNSKRTVEIKAGNGVIEARELPDGLRFKTQTFDLTNDKKKVFTAAMLLSATEPPVVPPAKQPSDPPVKPDLNQAVPEYVESPEFIQWKANVATLAADQQLVAVSKKLQELNPRYDGKIEPQIENGHVIYLRINTDHVSDISPVRAIPGLQRLHLGSSGPLSGSLMDLAPLSGLKIWKLNLIGNRVTDLSPIQGLKLTDLNCAHTRVTSLKPIAGMRLENLDCNNSPIDDFSPLGTLRLRTIIVGMERPEELVAALPILRQIKTLESINHRPAEDVFRDQDGLMELQPVLAQLKEANPKFDGASRQVIFKGHVTELTLSSKELRDLSPLQGLPKLSILELGINTYWDLSDLSGLKGLSLTSLGIHGASVVDLTPLTGMPIKYLNLHRTKVRDLTPLQGMPLEVLNCYDTSVTDFTAIADAPLQEVSIVFSSPAENIPALKTLQSIKTLKVFNGKPKQEIESQIAGLTILEPILKKLQKMNPQYNGKVRWIHVDQGKLTAVSIAPAGEFRHLAPFAELTDLKNLDLDSSNFPWAIDDLTDLKGLKLERLGIRGAQVSDLTPLEGMPLKSINLTFSKVTDLTPLTKTPLTEIELFYDRERDFPILKTIKTLDKINGRSAVEVFK